ncbi:MAG: histidine kinase [Comamonadaceae bacterium]|nr:MAG: histidine kinase [Comamonadaceae bacterium]
MAHSPSPQASPPHAILPDAGHRLALIEQARRSIMFGLDAPGARDSPGVEGWIERSWRRCLSIGLRPEEPLAFELVSSQARRRAREANQQLVEAATPVMENLGRAVAGTRYFAILTNAAGMVVDVNGHIDRSDRRAQMITRIGVDLSESRAGTTAISAALAELQPVWLHRNEHFFNDTSAFSCAAAPLFGPDGHCAGMLDLTGVDVPERPELKHLVAQAARQVENALTLQQPHSLLLRLNWPGVLHGGENEGLVCVSADGRITGVNRNARQMFAQLAPGPVETLPHCNEVFAMPFEVLFDAARRAVDRGPLEVPLWSGLRLDVWPQLPLQAAGREQAGSGPATTPRALREIGDALIRNAVNDAKGNVLRAAKTLGISRATVYRRLGVANRRKG